MFALEYTILETLKIMLIKKWNSEVPGLLSDISEALAKMTY